MRNYTNPGDNMALTMHTVQGTSTIYHGPISGVRYAEDFARHAAAAGHSLLVRVWGERFVCAFSVNGGTVTTHNEVTIPTIHWGD